VVPSVAGGRGRSLPRRPSAGRAGPTAVRRRPRRRRRTARRIAGTAPGDSSSPWRVANVRSAIARSASRSSSDRATHRPASTRTNRRWRRAASSSTASSIRLCSTLRSPTMPNQSRSWRTATRSAGRAERADDHRRLVEHSMSSSAAHSPIPRHQPERGVRIPDTEAARRALLGHELAEQPGERRAGERRLGGQVAAGVGAAAGVGEHHVRAARRRVRTAGCPARRARTARARAWHREGAAAQQPAAWSRAPGFRAAPAAPRPATGPRAARAGRAARRGSRAEAVAVAVQHAPTAGAPRRGARPARTGRDRARRPDTGSPDAIVARSVRASASSTGSSSSIGAAARRRRARARRDAERDEVSVVGSPRSSIRRGWPTAAANAPPGIRRAARRATRPAPRRSANPCAGRRRDARLSSTCGDRRAPLLSPRRVAS